MRTCVHSYAMAHHLPALFLKQASLVEATGMPPKRCAAAAGEPSKKARTTNEQNKRYSYNTLQALGAVVGQRIRGVRASDGDDIASADSLAMVAGTEFEVVSGCVWPNREARAAIVAELGEAGWARKLAEFLHLDSDYKAQAVIEGVCKPIGKQGRRWPQEGEPGYQQWEAEDKGGNSSVGLVAHGSDADKLTNMTWWQDMSSGKEECKLKIISLGPKWQHLMQPKYGLKLGDVLTPQELMRKIIEGFEDGKSTGDCDRPGHLVLRRHQWITGPVSGPVARGDTSRPVYVRVHESFYPPGEGERERVAMTYDVDTGDVDAKFAGNHLGMQRFEVPASADAAFDVDAARRVYDDAFENSMDTDEHELVWRVLNQDGVKAGALKSIMQKLIRFGAPRCRLPAPVAADGVVVDTERVVVAATLLCLSTKGDSYLPDLHMSVRGVTAACKRLAVIAVEDAWFAGDGDRSGTLVGLLAMAMVSARYDKYHPTPATAYKVAKLAGAMVASKRILPAQNKHASLRKRTPTSTVPANADAMQKASRLLYALRSFDGDMRMLALAADMAKAGTNTLPVFEDKEGMRMDVVPLEHCIDQHVYRGIAHMVATMPTDPKTRIPSQALNARYRTVFDRVTGFNPRVVGHGDEEFRPFGGNQGEADDAVARVRKAQQLMALHVFKTQLLCARPPALADENLLVTTATLPLHASIIAQAVELVTVDVSTTREENEADIAADTVYDMAGSPDEAAAERARAVQTLGARRHPWKLTVLMGMQSETPTVVRPMVVRKSGASQPRITETAKAKAIEAYKAESTTANGRKGYVFKSRLLPRHTHVYWSTDKKAWIVRGGAGATDIQWSWDPADADTAMTLRVPIFLAAPAAHRSGNIADDARAQDALHAPALPKERLGLETAPAGVAVATADAAAGIDADPVASVVDAVVASTQVEAAAQGLSARIVLTRLYSTVAGSYDAVAVPVPALNPSGGHHPDELKPMEGDWLVYRALLSLALAIPSALHSNNPAKLAFSVPDARALRCVEAALRSAVDRHAADGGCDGDGDAAAMEQSGSAAYFRRLYTDMNKRWDQDSTAWKPMAHQRTIVDTMQAKDTGREPTRGHMLQLDVGLGKTVIGMLYALEYAKERGSGIRRIIWATKSSLLQDAKTELTSPDRTLRLPAASVKIIQTADTRGGPKRDAAGTMFCVGQSGGAHIFLMPVEALSGMLSYSAAITDRLVEVAHDTLFVIDEVHKWYTNADRNNNLMQAVSVAPKYLGMTATAMASPTDLMAKEFFKGCVHFPVDKREDLFVAMTGMVSGKVQLFVTENDVVVKVQLTPEQQIQHNDLLPGQFYQAAQLARAATQGRFLETVVDYCYRDRYEGLGEDKKPQPDGGVLVFAADAAAADAMLPALLPLLAAKWRNEGKPEADAPIAVRRGQRPDGGGSADWNALKYWGGQPVGVVVTTADDAEGYNLQRLGAIVSGVYESNPNTRKQRRGRIKRIGQTRRDVFYVRVVPEGTILEKLDDRHMSNDAASESLASIAQLFSPDAMQVGA